MSYLSMDDLLEDTQSGTYLFYAPPGVGKSTMLGIIAEKSIGNTLVLDVDRTITQTLKKKTVVKDTSKISVRQVSLSNTWDDWNMVLAELDALEKEGRLLSLENICIDNISELERCLLADLGSKGKNDGVPSQGDYQKVQFKIVNSLRHLKQLGLNLYITAWETVEQFSSPDGSQYSRVFPKMSVKIVDNVCGLCDIVAKIGIDKDGERTLTMDAVKNVYAKNQIDDRKYIKVGDFINE